mgnify:CR=1 FL=1
MVTKSRSQRLGDLLLKHNIITRQQLDKALKVQKETGERLGKVLVDLGYATDRENP